MEQVSQAKVFGVFLTPIYSMLTHANCISGIIYIFISVKSTAYNNYTNKTNCIMSQGLYLLNQLRKQDLNIKCLTELFVGLVVTWFQYALPLFAEELTFFLTLIESTQYLQRGLNGI